MRNMGDNVREECACGTPNDRSMECCMSYTRRDREYVLINRKAIQTSNRVDVDEVSGPRHSKRHHGHETLPTGQNTTVSRGQFGEHRHSVVNGLRRVISKRSRLHRIKSPERVLGHCSFQKASLRCATCPAKISW